MGTQLSGQRMPLCPPGPREGRGARVSPAQSRSNYFTFWTHQVQRADLNGPL